MPALTPAPGLPVFATPSPELPRRRRLRDTSSGRDCGAGRRPWLWRVSENGLCSSAPRWHRTLRSPAPNAGKDGLGRWQQRGDEGHTPYLVRWYPKACNSPSSSLAGSTPPHPLRSSSSSNARLSRRSSDTMVRYLPRKHTCNGRPRSQRPPREGVAKSPAGEGGARSM